MYIKFCKLSDRYLWIVLCVDIYNNYLYIKSVFMNNFVRDILIGFVLIGWFIWIFWNVMLFFI